MYIFLIAITTLVASIIGTITGFGVSTILIPVLLFFLPLPQALLVAGVLHWFDDIWKLILFRKGVHWKLILYFGIPGILFSYLGAKLIFSIDEKIILRVLGVVLIFYSFYLIFDSLEFKEKMSTAVVGGSLSGFFAGITGLGGVIRAAFLTSFNLKKAVHLATIGAIALFVDSTRLVTYVLSGARLDKFIIFGFLLFIPISFCGAEIAKKIVDKIPQKKFRKVIAIFIILFALKLIIIP